MNYHLDSIDMAMLFTIMVFGLLARFGGTGRSWPPR